MSGEKIQDPLEPVRSVVGAGDLVARAREELGEELADVHAVFDHDDPPALDRLGDDTVAMPRARNDFRDGGQADHEGAPLAGAVAGDLHRAAVELDDASHDGEPEADAALGAREGAVGLRECFEYAVEHVGGDAHAAVGHADDGFVAVDADRDRHAAAPRRVLDRVRHQVREDLLEALQIPVHPRLGRLRLEGKREVMLAGAGLERLERVPRHLDEVEPPPLEDDLAVGDARDVEEIVDEASEVFRLPVDDAVLLEPRRVRVLPLDHGDGQTDGAERVSELVAEHRQEGVARLDGLSPLVLALAAADRRVRRREHRPRADRPVEDGHVPERAGDVVYRARRGAGRTEHHDREVGPWRLQLQRRRHPVDRLPGEDLLGEERHGAALLDLRAQLGDVRADHRLEAVADEELLRELAVAGSSDEDESALEELRAVGVSRAHVRDFPRSSRSPVRR